MVKKEKDCWTETTTLLQENKKTLV